MGPEFDYLGYSDVEQALARQFRAVRNENQDWRISFFIDYRGSFSNNKVSENSVGKFRWYKLDNLVAADLIIAEKTEPVNQAEFALEIAELVLNAYDGLVEYLQTKQCKGFDTDATRATLVECIEKFLQFESYPEDAKERALKIQSLLSKERLR
ncbi:MAG: hypothetical protein R2688_03480 [Fimbriimonadaceae bacterium]